jgi:hypothetical protein
MLLWNNEERVRKVIIKRATVFFIRYGAVYLHIQHELYISTIHEPDYETYAIYTVLPLNNF